MQKKTKSEYIQFLSVVSCLAVVFLHANGIFWGFSYERYWITANWIESIMYFAVPVFFMISGATLMNYRERYSTRVFFQKRIKKTVVPFVCWSILAVLWRIFWSGQEIRFNRELLDGIFNTRYVGIYYFFPALFSVYLSIPILSAIEKDKRKEVFGYAAAACCIVNMLLPLLCVLIGIGYNENLRIPAVSGYLVYIFAGYWIDNFEIPKRYRYLIYALGICGLAVHAVGTQLLSYQAGTVIGTFKGYTNLPCFFYAAAVFTLFKYMKPGKLYSLLSKISKPFVPLTFGIYLVHWYILEAITEILNIDMRSFLFRTVGAVGVFLSAAVLVFVIQKIPIIKKIIPE